MGQQQWHVRVMGQTKGPMSQAELVQMARSGRLAPGDPVRQGEGDNWVPAASVQGLFPGSQQPSAAPLAPKKGGMPPPPPITPAAAPGAAIPPSRATPTPPRQMPQQAPQPQMPRQIPPQQIPQQFPQQMPQQMTMPPRQRGSGIGTGVKIAIGGCLGMVLLMGGCVTILGIIGMSAAKDDLDKNGGVNHPTASTAREPDAPPRRVKPPVPEPPAPAAANKNITMEKYGQLRNGMSYAQVCRILGKQGTEISSSELGGISTVMYSWQNDGFLPET
jgi:hypothetical protein